MAWSEELEEENGWIDLEIVESWNIPKRYVAGSFPEDVWIREEACEFEEKGILKNQVHITLPKGIELIQESSEEFLASYIRKLCSEWFPQAELYIAKEWNCGFAFLLPAEQTDRENFYEKTVNMMETYDEEIMFYDKEVEETYTTVTVKNNYIDEENDEESRQMYSFPFLFGYAEKQLVGIIVCDTDDAAIWKQLSYPILRSIT